MEKYYEVGKEYLRHHAAPSFAAAAALLILSPLVVGIRNLDTAQSARVLETFVALIGILLFVPIFLPEQDRALRDVVSARYIRMEKVYSVRAALAQTWRTRDAQSPLQHLCQRCRADLLPRAAGPLRGRPAPVARSCLQQPRHV